jgi:hypothetical protein
MIWREPDNHVSDCYFCLTNVDVLSSKNKSLIQYPDLSSATKPIVMNQACQELMIIGKLESVVKRKYNN